MSVTQKVLAGLAILLAILAAAVALTAWVTSWPVALALWIGGAGLVVLAAVRLPVRSADLRSTPAPCRDFAESLARFEAEGAETADRLNPLCHPVLLHHGAKTATAVVLIHGISSCPRAFVDFAPLLHARGHNVLAVRMPCNGLADRATDALDDLTAGRLAAFGDASVDLARGLGEEVVVCGISAGGTVAAWIAETRADVARAVLIAPFLGLPGIGATLNRLVMRLMLLLPPVSVWKDPVLRERFVGMPHAYKRQSTRGTGEVLRLGHAARALAAQARPKAESLVLVTNANDRAIDNRAAEGFADLCDATGGRVRRYGFPKSLGLGHEIIDPLEPGANPEVTYPVLVALIEGGELPESPAGSGQRRGGDAE